MDKDVYVDWFWQNFLLGKQIKHMNSCFSIFLRPQICSCSTLLDFLENVLSHWLHDIMGLLFWEHDFLCNFKLSFFENTVEQYLHWWLEMWCFFRLNWSLSSKLQKEQVTMVVVNQTRSGSKVNSNKKCYYQIDYFPPFCFCLSS